MVTVYTEMFKDVFGYKPVSVIKHRHVMNVLTVTVSCGIQKALF